MDYDDRRTQIERNARRVVRHKYRHGHRIAEQKRE